MFSKKRSRRHIPFFSLLWWLPLAIQIFTPPPQEKDLARLNTVLPTQCGGSRGFQIFPIGDFGGGADTTLKTDPGILVADYVYDTIGPPAPGAYTITNQTGHWGGPALNWLDTGDRDPNYLEGYTLVVNGDTTAGVFMEYTLNVCESTVYSFGFDILNLYDTLAPPPASQPNIDVIIDGDVLYSTNDIPRNGQWAYHEFAFKTEPGATQITVALANNTPAGDGNVFALDNFFLGPCGPDLLIEEIDAQPRCVGDTIQLRLSSFGTPFDTNYIQWQSSLNQGRRWTNVGPPTTDSILTINGLRDGLWYRAWAANSRTGISTPSCRVFTNEVIIRYNTPANCANYPFDNVGALCSGSLGDNIFPDGEFGSGEANVLAEDPGISPFYQYQPNPPPNDGFYTITNNTTNWPSFGEGWLDTRDNSPDPNGYMMVVNADFNPGIFYIDTLQVCDNTLYEFSADVFNLHQNQPFFVNPNIEFQINDVSILRSGEVPQDSAWHTYGFTFTTKPGATELILSIRNFAPGGQDNVGNDFALDNIRLRPCGPEVAVFEVDPQPRCVGDPVEIRAGITTGYADPSILWQTSDDGGVSWEDFRGPTTDSVLIIDALPDTVQFRALVAETPEKLDQPACRIISNAVILDYPPIEDCWETPIDVVGDLCMGNLGQNGVENGDFGRDSTLFGSPLETDVTTYFFLRDSFERDGSYTITNDLNYDPCLGSLQDTCWIPLQDQSGDSLGYFMVINADAEPGIFFRGEVEGLCEDISYQFSADIINLNRTFFYPEDSLSTDTITLPNVDFIIGRTGVARELQTIAPAIYNSDDISNDSMWHTVGFTFTMKPGVSDLSLALRNNAPGGDLALDNITISVCGPDATIAPYQLCKIEPLTLEAVTIGDQFPNQVIQWEQSTDDGMSWTAIPGATTEELFIANPTPGHQYRYLVANSVAQLSQPLCHISSEIDTIQIQPEAVTNLQETVCEGESITIGNNTYSETGFFQEILTAENGCDSIVQLELTVVDTILTVLNVGLCVGEDFQGLRPTQDTVLIFPGTSAAGCDSTLQINVRLSELRPFEISGNTVLCNGESTVLSVPQSGFYEWSTGETSQSITVDSAGAYSVTVRDELGCEETASINVQSSQLQPFTLTVNDTLCIGETTTLTAPQDGNYLWSTGETTRSITVGAGGDYGLTITDELGCEESAVAAVVGTSLTDPVAISGNTFLCGDESTTLTVEAGGNYLWSTGETTASIVVETPGDYGVTVTDLLGCEASGSVSVTQNELFASVDVEAPICAGDSDGRLTVTGVTGGNGKITYQLNGGAPQESPVFDNLAAGAYTLTVADEQGCAYETPVTIPEGDQLTVELLPLEKPLRLNDSIRLEPLVTGTPAQISWSPAEGLSCTDCLNPIAKPAFSTVYTLTISTAGGCTRSATLSIEVDDSRRIFIPNVFAPGGDEPNNQFFTIFGGNDIVQINQLLIFDRWGNQVFQAQNIAPNDLAGGWDGTFKGQPAQSGVYIYYAEVAFSDGVDIQYSGDVTLMR